MKTKRKNPNPNILTNARRAREQAAAERRSYRSVTGPAIPMIERLRLEQTSPFRNPDLAPTGPQTMVASRKSNGMGSVHGPKEFRDKGSTKIRRTWFKVAIPCGCLASWNDNDNDWTGDSCRHLCNIWRAWVDEHGTKAQRAEVAAARRGAA